MQPAQATFGPTKQYSKPKRSYLARAIANGSILAASRIKSHKTRKQLFPLNCPAQTPQTVSAAVEQKCSNSIEPLFAEDPNILTAMRTRPVSLPIGNVERGESKFRRCITYAEEKFLDEALTASRPLQVEQNFAEEEEKDGELKLAGWSDPLVRRFVMCRFRQWKFGMLETYKAEQQRPPQSSPSQ
jgi:hypothetical protein